jgi:type IV secretory pathway TraG/TraD family ATPase VirD4
MESTLNKVNAFLFDPDIRQMLSASKSSFNLREIMDEGKILLIKLDKGRMKGINADLLGSLLLAKIQAAAFARTDTPEDDRRKFYLYIDEFQNFATESFETVLAEAGKYRLLLTLANQNLAQLIPSLRASILSNCGLQAYFRISRIDADVLAKESFASIYSNPPGWEWYIQELQELQPRRCYVKNKTLGGVIDIYTADLKRPCDMAGMDEETFAEMVRGGDIGGAYLRRREDVEEEYRARRKILLADDEPESFNEKVSK